MTKKKWIILIVSLLVAIGILFLLQHTAWIHNYACVTSEEKHSGCCSSCTGMFCESVCEPCPTLSIEHCSFKILLNNLFNL